MKTVYLAVVALLILSSCSSKAVVAEKKNYTVQYKEDFRSVNDQYEIDFLKSLDASGDEKSVIHFTQGYKGEKISATSNGKNVYTGYPLTNLKIQYASYFAFKNDADLIITDRFSGKQITIESKKAVKYKHIYVMKTGKGATAHFTITFSNTLRPVK